MDNKGYSADDFDNSLENGDAKKSEFQTDNDSSEQTHPEPLRFCTWIVNKPGRWFGKFYDFFGKVLTIMYAKRFFIVIDLHSIFTKTKFST